MKIHVFLFFLYNFVFINYSIFIFQSVLLSLSLFCLDVFLVNSGKCKFFLINVSMNLIITLLLNFKCCLNPNRTFRTSSYLNIAFISSSVCFSFYQTSVFALYLEEMNNNSMFFAIFHTEFFQITL